MIKKENWFLKNNWHIHIAAVFILLAITMIYFLPALQGLVISTHDGSSFIGMTGQGVVNHYHPGNIWRTNMFSGMPEFAIGIGGVNSVVHVPGFRDFMYGNFPAPINLIFFAALGFYVLSCIFKIRYLIGIMAGLCYAFATYNVLIISPYAGHETKLATIALMPFMLSGLVLIWQKKYITGILLFSMSVIAGFQWAHLQIMYYSFIVLLIIGLFYFIEYIKQKQWKSLIVLSTITVVLLVLAYFVNAATTMILNEYSKASTRGGSVLANVDITKANTQNITPSTGHDSAYAMSYSMGIAEPLVLLMANSFGSGDLQQWQEEGPVMEFVQNHSKEVQQTNLLRITSPYWGGIGMTVGPPYIGIILVFLALVGLVILKTPLKWYILSIIVFAIFLSWGGYFWSFNRLILEYLPFYNKFRAPSMIMVIPQLLIPLLAVLALNEFAKPDLNAKEYTKKILYTAGGLILFLLVMYMGLNFLSPNDTQTLHYIRTNISAEQGKNFYTQFFDAVVKERQQLFLKNLWQCVWMIGICVGVLWLVLKKHMKSVYAFLVIGVLAVGDLINEDLKFVNRDSFSEGLEQGAGIQLKETNISQQLLQDTSYYRVADVRRTVSPFNDSYMAYYHNMIGGYSPAKLSIYQDLISYQLNKNNLNIYNMLNTKYFIFTGQDGREGIQFNPNNLGSCWLVKTIRFEPTAWKEMQALDSFLPSVAIVNEQDKAMIQTPVYNASTDSVKFITMRNDSIWYHYTAQAPQYAVFSEIFYVRDGWKAYFNGKELPIIKTNYALRGLSLPAGQGDILFVFKPPVLVKAGIVTTISSAIMWLIWLSVIGWAIYNYYRKHKKLQKG